MGTDGQLAATADLTGIEPTIIVETHRPALVDHVHRIGLPGRLNDINLVIYIVIIDGSLLLGDIFERIFNPHPPIMSSGGCRRFNGRVRRPRALVNCLAEG